MPLETRGKPRLTLDVLMIEVAQLKTLMDMLMLQGTSPLPVQVAKLATVRMCPLLLATLRLVHLFTLQPSALF